MGLTVGRVGRPHGLDGSFYVTRPKPRLLSIGASLSVAGRSAAIVRLSGTEQRPIVHQGITSREGAERCAGSSTTVERRDADACRGRMVVARTRGRTVLDGKRLIGTVSRIVELPSCEALEVCSPPPGGAPLLIPMVKDAVRRVDAERRRIDVDAEFLDLTGSSPGPGRSPSRRAHADEDRHLHAVPGVV